MAFMEQGLEKTDDFFLLAKLSVDQDTVWTD